MLEVRILGLAVVAALGCAACGGPLGNAPIVLTEVPNRPTGKQLIALGAERSGCTVDGASEDRLLVTCPEGGFEVPTFPGPPTLAVRCVDGRLDVGRCTALVRKVLLASENPAPTPH
jgi:hypothetical protein